MFKIALAVLFVWFLVVGGTMDFIASMNLLDAFDVLGTATNRSVNT